MKFKLLMRTLLWAHAPLCLEVGSSNCQTTCETAAGHVSAMSSGCDVDAAAAETWHSQLQSCCCMARDTEHSRSVVFGRAAYQLRDPTGLAAALCEGALSFGDRRHWPYVVGWYY